MTTHIGVHSLWPTLVLVMDYNDRFQPSIDDIIDKVEFEETPVEWGKTHKVSKHHIGYWSDDVISEFGLTDLDYEIDQLAREYARLTNMRFTTYKRTSWFTMYEKGDYAHIHNHQSASISGCYYYKSSGEDGNIFFTSPLPQMRANPAWTPMGGRNVFQTQTGRMLVFPGWVDHGVMTNETDEKRISLAFNIEFNYFDEDGTGNG